MKKWSLYIGSYSGIKVFIHWTFWIIIGWIFMMHFEMGHGWAEGLAGALFILTLFACVVLHEFGHALTAKKYGIPTRDITLYPIGGVASLDRMPEKPAQELAVAVAGPAVNVIIAGILYIFLFSTDQLLPISEIDHMSGDNFWFNIMAANVILAVFNLIPAFPMDGGRVLRAVLAFNMDKLKATTIAARVGQLLAIVFVFLGFFSNFWLVFIGLFIFLGAGAEAVQESTKSALIGYTASDVLIQKYTRLSPMETLEKAVQLLQNTQEQGFVVVENDQAIGVLTRKELIKGLTAYGNNSRVSDIMRNDFAIVAPNTPLQQVYEKLVSNNSQLAAVLDNGQLTGIVTVKGINEMIMVTKGRKK
ncbi:MULTISPECIES: site-2 protease family protein [Flagellimonas]|uniref:Zinc metalloprotease n=2 Tax=Flagellimonas TaxID=444459 RepID=A0A3A1NDL5_9FLAO|nr:MULTISPECIES: site-2 protease family protein [Allomuricauda]MBW8242827.1 site-2 protease family protein [Allomuricauda oceani]QII45441.1 site-2 protease family protein [Allomuricauda oceani]RIV42747.1 site-2 protease family protein [Allomuricauda maritima]TXJ91935.1 site-2 protease family protein [Allomuricauda maritima]